MLCFSQPFGFNLKQDFAFMEMSPTFNNLMAFNAVMILSINYKLLPDGTSLLLSLVSVFLSYATTQGRALY